MSNGKLSSVFDFKYTKYWKRTIEKPVDGIKIASPDDVEHYLNLLSISNLGVTLDLGSSFGRMCEVLTRKSQHVLAIDPDPSAVSVCNTLDYTGSYVGTAERTGLPDQSVDTVFSWAVFDTVDINCALIELNRICREQVIITGKNNNPFLDDNAALNAEKNAFLKGHPNKFLDLNLLNKSIGEFGFGIALGLIFEKRGDTALRQHKTFTDSSYETVYGYEYLIHLKKLRHIEKGPEKVGQLWTNHSVTMSKIARERGYEDCKSLFEAMGLDQDL